MSSYSYNAGVFLNQDTIRIFHQRWVVDSPRAVLLIAHGVGEHCGRYQNLIDALAGKQVTIYAMDHKGHGKSGGKRGHVERFTDYTDDLKLYVDTMLWPVTHPPGAPKIPMFLLGHSMGGLISTLYALKYPHDLDGLILSSSGLIAHKGPNLLDKAASRILSRLAPRVAVSNRLKAIDLSTDPATVQDYLDDPLVHDRISMRWVTEFMDTASVCCQRLSELAMPLLMIHGDQDHIASPESSQLVYDKARSTDKTLKIFEGLYHETMNEVPAQREIVLRTVCDWIKREKPNTFT